MTDINFIIADPMYPLNEDWDDDGGNAFAGAVREYYAKKPVPGFNAPGVKQGLFTSGPFKMPDADIAYMRANTIPAQVGANGFQFASE